MVIKSASRGAFCYDGRVIYLFHGSDVEKVREKAFAWVAAARAKEPQLAYVRLAKEEITPAALEEAALSGGLFVKRLLIVLDDPFSVARTSEDEEGGEAVSGASSVEESLDQLATSDNVILIVAPKLATPRAKKIMAKATKEYHFDAPRALPEVRGFNTNLVQALAARNKERLWTEIMRARAAGDAPEVVHGLLHWKARDLLEKGGRAWSPQEARKLSRDLITLLQESRQRGTNLSESLERFALSI